MAYIKENWESKTQRARDAKRHTEKMAEVYAEEIRNAINNTVEYGHYLPSRGKLSKDILDFIIEDIDSVGAIIKYAAGKTAVLNFASYKNPGGMFLNGSKSQEECLCHESFLYNVLSAFEDSFYAWNNRNKNYSMYLNRALYSPNVIFERDLAVMHCDVITCAAPNKSAAQKYLGVSDKENILSLESRIRFILDIAYQNSVDTLILGAYGCGVFGQDPTDVATIFRHMLYNEFNCFRKVIFAIPSGKNTNLQKFQDVFCG